MNKTLGLYLVGYKGFCVLSEILAKLGGDVVAYVVAARDSGVTEDYFEEIRALALENNLEFLRREDVVKTKVPEADIKYAIGWKWLLQSDNSLIIFHDSMLPEYRGFAPLVNALLAGEKKIGVTALLAAETYDSGPIVAQRTIEISYPVKIAEAIDNVSVLYAELAIAVYEKFVEDGFFSSKPQNESLATYSPWRDESDYLVPWSESSNYIKRFCDAVGTPYKGAKTYWGQRVLTVLDVVEIEDISVTDRSRHIGKIIRKKNNCPVVICGSGLLLVNGLIDASTGENILNQLPFRVRFTDLPR